MDNATLINLIGIVMAITGLIVTIVLFAIQQRKTWLLNSATMIISLADRFESKEMHEYRRDCFLEFEKKLKNEPVNITKCYHILGFFENIGYLVRRGVLDKGMVWNKFSWVIERYYLLLTYKTNYLQSIRDKEQTPDIYTEFEWLNSEMIKLDKKNGIFIFSKERLNEDNFNLRINELGEQETHLI